MTGRMWADLANATEVDDMYDLVDFLEQLATIAPTDEQIRAAINEWCAS